MSEAGWRAFYRVLGRRQAVGTAAGQQTAAN